MGVNLKISCSQGCLVFACTWKCGQRSRCTHTMRARTFVWVAVCVSRKLRPCPSYSGRRDRNNSVHWRSLYKGGGGTHLALKTYRVRQGWGVFRGVHMQQGSHTTNPMGAASKSSADPCHLACHQHAFTTRAQHLRVNGLAEL